jgi:group I intron endonuclease
MLGIIESSFSNRLLIDFKCRGIYGIRQNASKRIYVGSSKNVRTRIYQHLRALLAKKHHSRHFQRAWNKHGQEAFTVFLLEKVLETKMLDEREQFWMDYFRGFTKTFNSAPRAESTRDYKWTESQKKKIRGYRRGVWTADTRKRVSEALKQRHAKNPEWRKNAQIWLHSPKNEAKRIAAFTAALKRPEIHKPLVEHLHKVRKLGVGRIRKTYFDKFGRKSLGFNSPEEMDQACLKLHLEGKSCREIGRTFKIDHHGVSSRLRRLGVRIRGFQRRFQHRRKIRNLCSQRQ